MAFFMWPFVAFIIAIVNFRHQEYRKFILFFFIYYGLSFTINNPQVDANRYLEQLVVWSSKNFQDYTTTVSQLYSSGNEDRVTDPFVVSIDFLISRFTVSQGILFGVFAFLFGYVYLNSVSNLYDYKRADNSYIVLFYIFFFSILVSIFNINGFRFWMACWVYLNGAYHFVVNKGQKDSSIKYFLLALASILIHFSFILPVLLLLLYSMLGNRNYIYYLLLVISFFIPINFNEFSSFDIDAPDSIKQKSVRYLSEGYESVYQKNKEGMKWFIRYPFNYYFSGVSLIVINIKHGLKGLEQGTSNLFSFGLLFFAFSNFVKDESQLIRFTGVFNLIALAFIVRAYKDLQLKKIGGLEILAVFAFSLHFLLALRLGSESINALLFSPGLSALFQKEVSLYDLIF
jgi:hypothetical protein